MKFIEFIKSMQKWIIKLNRKEVQKKIGKFQYCVNKEFHNFVLNNSTKTKTYKLSPTAAIFFCPNRTFNSCDNYQYNGLRFVCIFADNMLTIKSKYDILKIVNTAKKKWRTK